MRNSLSILFMSLLFILTGCMKENRDNCPVSTHILFHYQADGESNVIDEYIESGTLFVFNAQGDLAEKISVSTKQLHTDGVFLTLPFGEYRLVCWGNVNGHTEITGSENLKNMRIHSPGFTASTPILTNDALYTGSIPLTVRKGVDDQVERLDFRAAHINLEIYVRSSVQPVIQVDHLMPQYNGLMEETQPFETTYIPSVSYTEEHEVFGALLNVFRFKNDNPIMINVELPGLPWASAISISLKDFMAQQVPPLTVEDKQEVTIPILIEFDGLAVICKIPEWLIEVGFPGIQ